MNSSFLLLLENAIKVVAKYFSDVSQSGSKIDIAYHCRRHRGVLEVEPNCFAEGNAAQAESSMGAC
jgi:hypothetical protein